MHKKRLATAGPAEGAYSALQALYLDLRGRESREGTKGEERRDHPPIPPVPGFTTAKTLYASTGLRLSGVSVVCGAIAPSDTPECVDFRCTISC